MEIWALSDGRPANRDQAAGLAEAIARRVPARVREHVSAPKPWAARLPSRLWRMAGVRAGGWPFTGYEAPPGGPWPALVVGAGRRVAPLAAAIGKVHGARTVQVMDPHLPRRSFDLIVVPGYDGLTGGNVLTTLGAPNRITPARVAEAAKAWRPRLAHLPAPRLACLVGGPSRRARWRRDDVERLVDHLAALSRRGTGLVVIPSSRTDPKAMAALRADSVDAATWIWDGRGETPYPAVLGLADAALVTADSASLASEAASSGLPVLLFPISGASPRLRAFHAALAERGVVRAFDGRVETWPCMALAEADRVAGEIVARLAL